MYSTCTHNLCFRAKIRYIKVKFKGVTFTRTCYSDVILFQCQTHPVYNVCVDKVIHADLYFKELPVPKTNQDMTS